MDKVVLYRIWEYTFSGDPSTFIVLQCKANLHILELHILYIYIYFLCNKIDVTLLKTHFSRQFFLKRREIERKKKEDSCDRSERNRERLLPKKKG